MSDPVSIAVGGLGTGAGLIVTLKGWPLIAKLLRSENGSGCKAHDVGTQFQHIADKLDGLVTEMTKVATLLQVVVDRMK